MRVVRRNTVGRLPAHAPLPVSRFLSSAVLLRCAAALWLIGIFTAAGLATPHAITFLGGTSSSFSPPLGSTARLTERALGYYFSSVNTAMIDYNLAYVTVAARDGKPIFSSVNDSSAVCIQRFSIRVYEGEMWHSPGDYEFNVAGYFLPHTTFPEISSESFVSFDKSRTVIVINTKYNHELRTKFPATLQCSDVDGGRQFDIDVTSILSAVADMKNSVIADLAHVDSISLPFAFVIFAVAVRSLRLLIVPLLVLPVASLYTFAMLQPFAETHRFSTMAPAVISAVIVALSVDFSLFIISRFREKYAFFIDREGVAGAHVHLITRQWWIRPIRLALDEASGRRALRSEEAATFIGDDAIDALINEDASHNGPTHAASSEPPERGVPSMSRHGPLLEPLLSPDTIQPRFPTSSILRHSSDGQGPGSSRRHRRSTSFAQIPDSPTGATPPTTPAERGIGRVRSSSQIVGGKATATPRRGAHHGRVLSMASITNEAQLLVTEHLGVLSVNNASFDRLTAVAASTVADSEGIPDITDDELAEAAQVEADALLVLPRHLLELLVVKEAVGASFRNIVFSGSTIALVFGCLMVTPDAAVRTLAAGTAVGAVATVLVTFGITPVLLFLMFRPLTAPPPGPIRRCWRRLSQRLKGAAGAVRLARPQRTSPTSPEGETLAITPRVGDDAGNPLCYTPITSGFFSARGFASAAGSSTATLRSRSDSSDDGEGVDRRDRHDAGAEAHVNVAHLNAETRRSPFWFRLARFVTGNAWGVLLVFLLVSVPCLYAIIDRTEVTFNIFAEIPEGYATTERLQGMFGNDGNKFSSAIAGKFYIVFLTTPCCDHIDRKLMRNPKNPILTDVNLRLIEETTKVLEANLATAHVKAIVISPTRTLQNSVIANVSEYLPLTNKHIDFAARTSLLFNIPEKLDIASGAVITIAVEDGNPWGRRGMLALDPIVKTYNHMKGIVNDDTVRQATLPGLDPSVLVGYYGPNVDSYAISRNVYSSFHLVVGLTAAACFVSCAITFRALFVALRMVVTIAFTMVAAYAIGALIYCSPVVLDDRPEDVQGYMWLMPLLSFSIVAALTLDYDSFVLTRTVELRNRGFSHRMAICKAVSSTGSVVSFAAAVMAVAFGSLMLSPVLMLQQFGCIVATAVLVDAFFVRSMLVPALMSVFPRVAWWPRTFASNDEIEVEVDADREHGGSHTVSLTSSAVVP
jgi:hypothetical protein